MTMFLGHIRPRNMESVSALAATKSFLLGCTNLYKTLRRYTLMRFLFQWFMNIEGKLNALQELSLGTEYYQTLSKLLESSKLDTISNDGVLKLFITRISAVGGKRVFPSSLTETIFKALDEDSMSDAWKVGFALLPRVQFGDDYGRHHEIVAEIVSAPAQAFDKQQNNILTYLNNVAENEFISISQAETLLDKLFLKLQPSYWNAVFRMLHKVNWSSNDADSDRIMHLCLWKHLTIYELFELLCDEHAMSDTAPIIVWRIFNERLKAYIRSGMELCVVKFQKRIASRKCLQRCMKLLDRVSGTKPEVMVGCLLCLQVLKTLQT